MFTSKHLIIEKLYSPKLIPELQYSNRVRKQVPYIVLFVLSSGVYLVKLTRVYLRTISKINDVESNFKYIQPSNFEVYISPDTKSRNHNKNKTIYSLSFYNLS